MQEPEEETDEEWGRIADIMSVFEAQYMSSHNTIANNTIQPTVSPIQQQLATTSKFTPASKNHQQQTPISATAFQVSPVHQQQQQYETLTHPLPPPTIQHQNQIPPQQQFHTPQPASRNNRPAKQPTLNPSINIDSIENLQQQQPFQPSPAIQPRQSHHAPLANENRSNQIVSTLQTQLQNEREQRVGECSNLRNRIKTLQQELSGLRETAAKNANQGTEQVRLTRELTAAQRDRDDLATRLSLTRAELAAARDREQRYLTSSSNSLHTQEIPEKAIVPPMTQPGDVVEATQRFVPSQGTGNRIVKRRKRKPPLPYAPSPSRRKQAMDIGGTQVLDGDGMDDIKPNVKMKRTDDNEIEWKKDKESKTDDKGEFIGYGINLNDTKEEESYLREDIFRRKDNQEGWEVLTRLISATTIAEAAAGDENGGKDERSGWNKLVYDAARLQRGNGACSASARIIVNKILRHSTKVRRNCIKNEGMKNVVNDTLVALKKRPNDENVHSSISSILYSLTEREEKKYSEEEMEVIRHILQVVSQCKVDRLIIQAAEVILEMEGCNEEDCGRAMSGLGTVSNRGSEDVAAAAAAQMAYYAPSLEEGKRTLLRLGSNGHRAALSSLSSYCVNGRRRTADNSGNDGNPNASAVGEVSGLVGVIGCDMKTNSNDEIGGWKTCVKEYNQLWK